MSGSIDQIKGLIPGAQSGLKPNQAAGPNDNGAGFTELFSQIIDSVNGLQMEAGRAQELLASGELAELHEVMIAMEEAGISMDLLLEIRNRLVDAYQTFMRMPM